MANVQRLKVRNQNNNKNHKEVKMTSKELLLAIHNQCEATQKIISAQYSRPCVEILKEILYLQSLLIAYIIKNF